MEIRCWCGSTEGRAVVDAYARCVDCRTLVWVGAYDPEEYLSVGDGESGFYGERYWRERVPQELGLPTLKERSRDDLGERAAFYLERILRWHPPTGRILDLGCGPGTLTYLLAQSGFDAEGLEMSPRIAREIEKRFGVPVLVGPLAERPPAQRYSAIVAVDVLEHLPEPLETLRRCASAVEENGLLFLQTPCYRGEGADWEMFLPREHLFLYDEESIRRLLASAGFAELRIEHSVFPYDMWVTAARKALPAPSASPPTLSPLLQALIDSGRKSRQKETELAEVRSDQAAKEQLVERLSQEVAEARSDQGDKEQLIERLSQEVAEVRSDQGDKEQLIARLSREIEQIERDRGARLQVIEELDGQLGALRRELSEREGVLRDAESSLGAANRRIDALERSWPLRIGRLLRLPSVHPEGDR